MEKLHVRQQILAALKGQDRKEKQVRDLQLLEDLTASKAYQDAKVIATYLAFDFEYDTQLLIRQAEKDGKCILVPKTYPQGRMVFCPYEKESLVQTSFGLWEPLSSDEAVDKSEIDLIHVPGVAFNRAFSYWLRWGLLRPLFIRLSRTDGQHHLPFSRTGFSRRYL